MEEEIVARPRVCVFDSGIGGINLLICCTRLMPQVDFYYFADNYNVPYGNLPPQRIRGLVGNIFEKIAAFSPSAAVIACNTATAVCAGELRKKYSFHVVGVEPAVKQAAEYGGKFLVLATKATCASPSFSALIKKYGALAEVYPCADLAERIEREILSPDLGKLAEVLPVKKYSSVVLGCTHYVFIKEQIRKRFSCPVFDGMAGTADHLLKILGTTDHFTAEKGQKLNNSENKGKIEFICGNITKNYTIFEKFKQCNM